MAMIPTMIALWTTSQWFQLARVAAFSVAVAP
jgi:hypothetical protein